MSNPDLSKPLWQFIVAKKGKLRYNTERDTNAKEPAEGNGLRKRDAWFAITENSVSTEKSAFSTASGLTGKEE